MTRESRDVHTSRVVVALLFVAAAIAILVLLFRPQHDPAPSRADLCLAARLHGTPADVARYCD